MDPDLGEVHRAALTHVDRRGAPTPPDRRVTVHFHPDWTGRHDPQVLKKVWHLLARFGMLGLGTYRGRYP